MLCFWNTLIQVSLNWFNSSQNTTLSIVHSSGLLTFQDIEELFLVCRGEFLIVDDLIEVDLFSWLVFEKLKLFEDSKSSSLLMMEVFGVEVSIFSWSLGEEVFVRVTGMFGVGGKALFLSVIDN